jgi:ADP-ribose pyrophosphatase
MPAPRDPILPPPRLRPWTRVRNETVARHRIFEIDRGEWVDGAGRARGDAITIRTRDWCNVVAVTPRDEIVLCWQHRFGTDSLSLEIPGGVVEAGEDPKVAAERELREETGYVVDALEPLLTVDPNPAIQNNRCFTFLGRGARLAGAPQLDAQEEIETVLVPVARVADLLDAGQVRHSLVQGALETFLRRRALAQPRP